MKKLFKILASVLLVIILLMLILPFVFKGKILEAVKSEIQNKVEAKVDFKHVSLSLFRDFPSLNLQLDELSILGVKEFDGDTLLAMKSFEVSFDLSSIWGDEGYKVNSVALNEPQVNLLVNKLGRENWDIAKSDDITETTDKSAAESHSTATTDASSSKSGINLLLDQFEINDAQIYYVDEMGEMSIGLDHFNFKLKGDLSAQKTSIDLFAHATDFTAMVGGIPYLNKADLDFRAGLDANLENMIFTFKKNKLSVNDLTLIFDGSVSMLPNEEINTLLTFSTPQTSFKNVLSMIPAVYSAEFKDLKTAGNFSLNGSVNGIYKTDHYPAFNVKLDVKNSMFQYPDLPAAVTDINIKTQISNPGGDLDGTKIAVQDFSMKMAGNPIRAQLSLTTPISDPNIDASVNGTLDLDKLKDIIPLEKEQQLHGLIKMDVSMKGKKSSLDQEKYEDFIALGSVLVQRFAFNAPGLPAFKISTAQLNFAPAYLDLVSFKSTIGSGDISAQGKIENYLAYALKGETIKAKLKTQSEFLNLNEFLENTETELDPQTSSDTIAKGAQESVNTQAVQDTASLEVFKLPENIDFELNSTFKKLQYDQLDLTNVNGKILVKEAKLSLKPLKANLLGGSFSADGFYLTKDIPNAQIAFNLDVKQLDIQKAYGALKTLRELAPSAKHIQGQFSTEMKISADMDAQMNLVYPTVNGFGQLQTSTLEVKNLPVMDKIADALKKPDLKNLKLDPTKLSFRIENGRVITTPFKIKSGDINATVAGYTALTKEIDYDIDLSFPRKDLGGDANNALDGLVDLANNLGANFSLGKTVNVAAKVNGTVDEPKVKIDFAKSLGGDSGSGSAGSAVKDKVKESVDQELLKQADNLEAEAAKQAQQLIQSAQNAANQLRTEGKKKAEEAIAEGKKQGWLGKKAAEKAADLISDNAEKAAKRLEDEAQSRASQLKANAKSQADALRAKAKK